MATKRLFFSCVVLMALTGAGTALWGQTAGFAYVANSNPHGLAGSVSAYAIDSTTGALSQITGSPFAAGAFPRGMAVDPTGKFLYVPNCGNDSCSTNSNGSAYTIDSTTGALSQITGSPFA